MSDQVETIHGKPLKIGSYRFLFCKIGVDISNGRRGIFLYYPFTKRHSYKQYRLIKWLFDTKTKGPK